MLQLTKIEPPTWSKSDTYINMWLSDYRALQDHRQVIEDFVDREVARHFDNADNYFTSAAGFPNIELMTGEYYYSFEGYRTKCNSNMGGPIQKIAHEIDFCAMFLQRHSPPRDESDLDYLSIHVGMKCDPETYEIRERQPVEASIG